MNALSRQDELKRAAAEAALGELIDGTVVGVGTGSTVNHFIDALAGRRQRYLGALSSSLQSSRRLEQHGIPVLSLDEVIERGLPVPVYVDGADEINPRLQMIKGGGGALTQEKIVAAQADRFVCVADESKLVERLGRFPLPVEVVASAALQVSRRFARMGGQAVLRAGFITDNGHPILDVSGLSIAEPQALEDEVNGWPGVVTVGLFARRGADLALIAASTGIRRLSV